MTDSSLKQKLFNAIILVGLIFLPDTSLAESLPDSARDAVRHYNRDEFEQALKSFEDAKSAEPDNPLIAYNLANSHYRMGNYDQAIQAYNEAENNLKDPELKVKSLYNKGNALFRMGYLDKAIESYKKALKLNPEDKDSKFNLEFARTLLERAEQSGRVMPRAPGPQEESMPGAPNPPAPNEEPGEDDEKGRSAREQTEDGPDKTDPDAKNDSDSKKDQDSSTRDDTPKQNPPENPASEEPQDGDKEFAQALEEATQMSEEEAEQWLNSLDEDLKKFAQRQMQGQMKDMFVNPQKDW